MKKLLLIALAAVIFVSCKKSSTKPTEASISGKWYFTTDTTSTYLNGALQSSDPSSFSRTDYVQFNSNGTGVSLSGGTTSTFTYSISGSNIVVSSPAQVSGGVSIPAITETGVIRSLTSTNLALIFTLTETQSGQSFKTTDAEYFTK